MNRLKRMLIIELVILYEIDECICFKLEGKFYKSALHLDMVYGTEFWAPKRVHVHKMSIAYMIMHRLDT